MPSETCCHCQEAIDRESDKPPVVSPCMRCKLCVHQECHAAYEETVGSGLLLCPQCRAIWADRRPRSQLRHPFFTWTVFEGERLHHVVTRNKLLLALLFAVPLGVWSAVAVVFDVVVIGSSLSCSPVACLLVTWSIAQLFSALLVLTHVARDTPSVNLFYAALVLLVNGVTTGLPLFLTPWCRLSSDICPAVLGAAGLFNILVFARALQTIA